MSENRLLKFQQKENKKETESVDLLPDMDLLDLTDLSFLMNYSLDEPEDQDNKAINAQNSWVGSSIVAATKSLSEDEEDSSETFSKALKDEFLGLVSNDDDIAKTDNQKQKYQFSTETGILFNENRAKQEMSNEDEDLEQIDITRNIDDQNYQSTIVSKKFSWIGAQEKIQIGLDIGKQNIKYVVVKKLGNRNIVLAFGIHANTLNKNASENEVVDLIIDEMKLFSAFPKARFAWNVYGPKVGMKQISLPSMKKQMIVAAVIWSAKKDMNLEEENAIIDFIDLNEKDRKEDKHQLLAVGCAEDVVISMASAFLARKITPFKVTPLPISLWKLYKDSVEFDSKHCVALIDIGTKTTIIAFINNGVLEFFREFQTGGKDITEALMSTIFYHGKPYQLDAAKAEELKRTFGFPQNDLEDVTADNVPVKEFSVLIRPILERLGNEVRRSIDYYKEHFSAPNLDWVFLLGGSSNLKNFSSFMSEFVEGEINTLTPSAEMADEFSELDISTFRDRFLELALPYSLAIDNDKSLNLLPPYIKKLQKLFLIKKASIYGVIFGFILLGLFSVFAQLNSKNYQSEYEMLQTQFKRLEPLKREHDALRIEQVNLLNKKNIYSEELILENPLPTIMQAVANLVPKGMALRSMVLEESVSNVEIQNSKRNRASKKSKNSKSKKSDNADNMDKVLLLSGVTLNPGPDAGINIADYMLNLSKTGLFESVKLESQNYNQREDELSFKIEAVIGK